MEDSLFNYENKQNGETLDVLANCASGNCIPTKALRLALVLLLAVVLLVGVPGNVMLAWLTRLRAQSYIRNLWFYHLAVADIFSCLSLPALVLPIILQGHWTYGVTVGCQALPFFIFLSMYAKVLLLTALSLETFLLVLKPSRWTEKQRLYWVQVAYFTIWILAYLLALPLEIYHQVLMETYSSQVECMLDYSSWTIAENTVTAIQFIFGFLVPMVVTASCHGMVLCREGRPRWPLGMAAVVCFFVCWAPYHMLGLVVTIAAPFSTLWSRALLAEPFVVGLALAHSCINPILILYFGRAHLSWSLPATCRWALRDPGGNDVRVINRNSSSHNQVSETEVRQEEN